MKSVRIAAVILSSVLLGLAGCRTDVGSLAEYQSRKRVNEVVARLHVLMRYDELEALTGSPAILQENGSIHFVLKDGDLWVFCRNDYDHVERVISWETAKILPDGTTVTQAWNDQDKSKVLKDPFCIDVETVSNVNGRKMTASYEDYGFANSLVKFSSDGTPRTAGTFFVVGGCYLLLKGDVPEGAEFAILQGLTSQTVLLGYLFAKGIPKGFDSVKARTPFKLEDKRSPLVLSIPFATYNLPAPWKAEGYLEPDPGGVGLRFHIDLEAGNGGVDLSRTSYQGVVQVKQKEIPDGMPLEGWKQFRISRDGTSELGSKANTLVELRKGK